MKILLTCFARNDRLMSSECNSAAMTFSFFSDSS